ncbi:DUF4302 domain-containing protein [Chryseolinea lacunae]|uniref:DUF4302 domain-containing protein n=1 Tax=Chryseolinea lacunae TaxID=2801331 RepID=A0ABS1KM60_9BACT|nr:DUF4302 domain-containing protein [Chryseolinea lacunae]MBL0740549.1 DUF4302 domain-containing protein [Chryseolinea lacunae]
MKKLFIQPTLGIVWLCALLLTTACDRNYDTIFKETPDQRAQAELDQYNTLLMNAPNGWKASLYTGTGAGYFYYFDFKPGGQVTMLSDFNEETAGEPMETTWALKALQRATLSFTTYSYIHLPADPDGNVNNGLPGSGLLSDFEFAIVRTAGDSVVMKGVQHSAELVLVKASAEEQSAIVGDRILDLLQETSAYLTAFNGYRLTLPDQTVVPMALSIPQKLVSFQYIDSDGTTIKSPRTSYTFSINGIVLKAPITIHGFSVHALLWNDETKSYFVNEADGLPLVGSEDTFIFEPTVSLASLLDKKLITATLPEGAGIYPLPGQSDAFTDLYNETAAALYNGLYRLTLRDIRLVFPPNTGLMQFVVTFTQPGQNGSVSLYAAQYTYSYQLRDGGILKFKMEDVDQNGGLLYNDLIGMLNHFDNDTFAVKYVGGGFNVVAGFFSQEEQDYHFGGYLPAQ